MATVTRANATIRAIMLFAFASQASADDWAVSPVDEIQLATPGAEISLSMVIANHTAQPVVIDSALVRPRFMGPYLPTESSVSPAFMATGLTVPVSGYTGEVALITPDVSVSVPVVFEVDVVLFSESVTPNIMRATWRIMLPACDVDYLADGDVDWEDARVLLDHISGPANAPGTCIPGDVDGDGDADLQDIAQLQRLYTGALDCDGDGFADTEAIQNRLVSDCNGNQRPDSCDIVLAASTDCNQNEVPDECDIRMGQAADCNGNGLPDVCDIASGSPDCNQDGIPDPCQLVDDCNANGIPDSCDLSVNPTHDCDGSGVLDECELARDCDGNGILDICDPVNLLSVGRHVLSANDRYGETLASDGNTLVVGAPHCDWFFPLTADPGYALVFASGECPQRLEYAPVSPANLFGKSLAVSGDVIVVGAPADLEWMGAAFVFRRVGADWVQEAYLLSPQATPNGAFGISVATTGNRVFVGSWDECTFEDCGRVFVYGYQGSNWVLEDVLSAPIPDSAGFGWAIAATSDSLLVGAPANGEGGRAFIFRTDGTDWAHVATLSQPASAPEPIAEFGSAVGLRAGWAVVGAPNGTDGTCVRCGYAALYREQGGIWSWDRNLSPYDDRDSSARWGESVAIKTSGSDVQVVVGGSGVFDQHGRRSGNASIFRQYSSTPFSPERLALPIAEENQRGRAVAFTFGIPSFGAPASPCEAGSNCGTVYGPSYSQPTPALNGTPLATSETRIAYYELACGSQRRVVIAEHSQNGWLRTGILGYGTVIPATSGSTPRSIALTEDTLAVGEASEDAVHLCKLTANGWAFSQTIRPPEPDGPENFGYSIALDAGYMVVTSWEAGYVYAHDGQQWTWVQTIPLEPSFRTRVALDAEHTAIASIAADRTSATVQIFSRTGAEWPEVGHIQVEPELQVTPGSVFNFNGLDGLSINNGVVAFSFSEYLQGGEYQAVGTVRICRWNGSTWPEEYRLRFRGACPVLVEQNMLVIGDQQAGLGYGWGQSEGEVSVYRYGTGGWSLASQYQPKVGPYQWTRFGMGIGLTQSHLVVAASAGCESGAEACGGLFVFQRCLP